MQCLCWGLLKAKVRLQQLLRPLESQERALWCVPSHCPELPVLFDCKVSSAAVQCLAATGVAIQAFTYIIPWHTPAEHSTGFNASFCM